MCNLMTKGIVIVLFGAAVPVIAGEQRSAPSSEQQIEEALSPLPEALREGVAVWGFGESGEVVTLQEGVGLITCLADDPASRSRFYGYLLSPRYGSLRYAQPATDQGWR